jgi:hypothetical protein
MFATTLRAAQAVPITGSGLTLLQQQGLTGRLAQGSALADAIRSAVEQARAAGLDAFLPAALVLPDGLSVADRRFFFNEVIARPYSADDKTAGDADAATKAAERRNYGNAAAGMPAVLPEPGPLSLDDWSRAVEALALRVARDASLLPPGAGGGARQAYGAWFVNGERYTLAELFIAVRLGNVAMTETYLAGELDTLALNGRLARELLDLLSQMKRYRAATPAIRSESTGVIDPNDKDKYLLKDLLFDTKAGYTEILIAVAGASGPAARDAALPIAQRQQKWLDEFSDYGEKLKGVGKSLMEKAAGRGTLPSDEYAELMTEIQAVFDSVNADNQVKQIRVQTIENTRLNQLLGVSNFLNGIEAQGKSIVRGL